MISSEKRKILSHRKAHVWFRTLLFPVSIAAFAQLWDDSSRCHAEVSMLSLKTFNQSTRWCVRTFRAERSFTAAELQLVTVHTNLWAVGCRHRDMLSSIIAHFSSEQLVSLRLDSSNYQESVWSSVSQPGHTLSHCYCYPIGVTKSSPNGAYRRTSDVRLWTPWRGSASWDTLSDFGIRLVDSNVRTISMWCCYSITCSANTCFHKSSTRGSQLM